MEEVKKNNSIMKFIKVVERVGNKLPHPFILFGYFILITLVVSYILSKVGFEASYLVEGKAGEGAKTVLVQVVNLLTFSEMREALINLPDIYVTFPALKIVLIMMMAIGFLESTGFFNALMRRYLLNAPKSLITAALVFVGVNASVMSDAGTILSLTIGGVLFASLGRNPKLGIILGFAACSGGFTANIFVAGTDALLAGITEQAMEGMGVDMSISPLCNYYFMAASTVFLTISLTFVTEKFIVKLMPDEKVINNDANLLEEYKLKPEEHRGLRYSFYGLLIFIAVMLVLCLPQGAFFRNEAGEFLPKSPLLSAIVPILFFLFCSIGIGFGIGIGKIKSLKDLPQCLQSGVSKAVPLLVTTLTSALFLHLLNRSNIFKILAIKGSFILKSANVGPLPLLLMVVFITTLINPFMTSGSTKWILLSPMIVPMFTLLNISPAFAQLAFRIGDSATNIISPAQHAIPVILGLMAQYDLERGKKPGESEAGFGTIFSLTLPYSMTILFTMVFMMVVWYFLELPIGPASYLYIK